MVVDISHLHDHHGHDVLFNDAVPEGIHDVRPIFPVLLETHFRRGARNRQSRSWTNATPGAKSEKRNMRRRKET